MSGQDLVRSLGNGSGTEYVRTIAVTLAFLTLVLAVSGSVHADAEPTPKSDGDWKLNPTFGTSWATGRQLVTDGFSFNGRTFDVTDNYHVDFEKITAVIGRPNTITIKAYSVMPLEYVTLSLGVPDLSRATDAESDIRVVLGHDYTLSAGYEIVDVLYEQDKDLVDPEFTTVSVKKADCNESFDLTCHEFSIRFRVLAPLVSGVIAISAVDQDRRITTTYVNDGIEFAGESLLPADTVTLYSKKGNQHPVVATHLVQEDRRYNVWSDQYGHAWLQNEYGSWFQLTHAGFERLAESDEAGGSDAEQARAAMIFAERESHAGDSFSRDAPVRVDKLLDPVVLVKLQIAEPAGPGYLWE